MFDPEELKRDFPILGRKINGKQLVYLDSAATSQKPDLVLDAVDRYYRTANANIHRGAHTLGDEATAIYEDSRRRVAEFIGVRDAREVVFARNTTEAINMVAYAWGADNVGEGDTIVTSEMDHHANIVPWQELAVRAGARVEYIRVSSDGMLDLVDAKKKIRGKRVKLVAISHVSNALGTINPVQEIAEMARGVGARVVVDGAQAVPHMRIDVTRLGADFYAFSGHKMLGPMGIGVLWGRKELLDLMRPFLTGGGMISEVHKDGSKWADVPEKFEAGTPDVAGAVGLSAAVSYLDRLGMENVREHDRRLVEYTLSKLKECPIEILGSGNPELRMGSVSFVYRGVHAHDVATILDSEGVAVRSGHHCTMILHETLGIPASIRASFNVYTTEGDIDALVFALGKVKKIFGK